MTDTPTRPPATSGADMCQTTDAHGQPVCVRQMRQRPCTACPDAPTRRWTEATRELVAETLHADLCPEDPDDGDACMCDIADHDRSAGVALDALAAGLLADPQEATSVDCTVTREDVLHDGRCHSCDEPAQRHAPARVVARQQAHPDRWSDADIAKLADMIIEVSGAELEQARHQLEQLRAERDRLADEVSAHEGEMGDLRAKLSAADAEVDELRARVAELQQMVTDRSCRMCGGSHLVGGGLTLPCPACDVDNRPQPGWERHYCGTTGAQPGRWELPAEPGPEVTTVWDVEGVQWTRTAPLTWTRTDQPYDPWWVRWNWVRLLSKRGPLSATPPETARCAHSDRRCDPPNALCVVDCTPPETAGGEQDG